MKTEGQMPRHKDSVEKHLGNGTYRNSRHATRINAFDLELIEKMPPVPEELKESQLAIKLWQTILPPLIKTKRLAPEDLPILTIVFRQARVLEKLDRDIGEIIENGTQEELIKATDGMNRQIRTLVDLLKKFGVTSRGRQDIFASFMALNGDEKGDSFEDFAEEE